MKIKNMDVFYDGENVSSKKYGIIKKKLKRLGATDTSRVYGLQKDSSTKGWTEASHNDSMLKDIRLCGEPSKDKVDKKIKKDVRKSCRDKENIDTIVIVSSDGGFKDVVDEARKENKKVIVIGEKKTPKKLRESCSMFVEV